MKSYTLITLLSFIINLSSARAQETSFAINGTIYGLADTTTLYLITSLNKVADTVASCQPKNGKFYFKGTVNNGADWYFIKKNGTNIYIRIYLDNSIVNIEGSIDGWPNYVISGSRSHDVYQSFIASTKDLVDKRTQLTEKLKLVKDEAVEQELRDVREAINIKYREFIVENLDAFYTPFLINQPIFNLETKAKFYEMLSENVKASAQGKLLEEIIIRANQQSNLIVGKIAPNFWSLTPEREKVNLLDLVKKKKLTLIDFWGSWCVPCREETPNIKRVYDAFKDKGFSVLGVGLEFKADDWKRAISKDQMDWIHVSQLRGRSEDAHQIFALRGVPAYVLVDGDGKIIEMDLQGSTIKSSVGSLRGEALYRRVEEILGKSK